MPDNAGYMFAAYIAAALIIGGYVVSLVVRARAMARRGDAIDTAPRR
jgi:CcmD family protein